MVPLALRAAVTLSCVVATLWQAQAESGGQGQCRQGVLALILMIDAEEHERSHYRSTATSVVESCGPPSAAQKSAVGSVVFAKTACGRLAQSMLESIESTKMGSPEFVQARDAFGAQCRGG
jgi:hypothetical protein